MAGDEFDGVGPGRLSLSLRGLATASAILAVASLATLVTVASIKDVDALSTVALALALLSFSAQLIVSLVQSGGAAKINAETQSALAEMKSTTASLLANQRDMVDRLIDFAVNRAVPAIVQDVQGASRPVEGGDDGSLTAGVAERIEESIRSRMREALVGSNDERTDVRKRDRALESLLATYPPRKVGEPVLNTLRSLEPRTLAALAKYALQLQSELPEDGTVTLARVVGQRPPTTQQLIQAGLLEEVEAPADKEHGRVRLKFTDTGIVAAQLLRASGGQPSWMLP